MPLYLAADGPRSLQLAGEVADGVYFMGGASGYGQMDRWTTSSFAAPKRRGRDPTKIDICAPLLHLRHR